MTLPANQWVITPREFVEQDYAGRVARGEVQVYYFLLAPEDLHNPEFATYIQQHGNVEPIAEVELVAPGGAFLYAVPTPSGGQGVLLATDTCSLLVLPGGM